MTEITTDYIVVGAGSAGCVLANRLSENGKHHVTLLEAGGSDNRFWIKIPIGYGRTFFDQRVNWKYRTEAEAGINNRSSYWPRGKVLGGSSSINAMVYIRGHPRDFDDWYAKGNTGWAYQDVLPYFKKSEDSELPEDEYMAKAAPYMSAKHTRIFTHYATRGSLRRSKPSYRSPMILTAPIWKVPVFTPLPLAMVDANQPQRLF